MFENSSSFIFAYIWILDIVSPSGYVVLDKGLILILLVGMYWYFAVILLYIFQIFIVVKNISYVYWSFTACISYPFFKNCIICLFLKYFDIGPLPFACIQMFFLLSGLFSYSLLVFLDEHRFNFNAIQFINFPLCLVLLYVCISFLR